MKAVSVVAAGALAAAVLTIAAPDAAEAAPNKIEACTDKFKAKTPRQMGHGGWGWEVGGIEGDGRVVGRSSRPNLRPAPPAGATRAS